MLIPSVYFWKDGLTAEAKMLFIYMVSEVDSDKVYKTSVLDMANKYGATVAMIERSIKVLIALELIERVDSTGRIKSGRPISTYRINEDMVMEYLKVKPGKPYFKQFKNYIDKEILNNQHMSLANKLLSLILFMHSDLGGRVKELDSKTIKKLTGFSRERLRTQIKKLHQLDFIRHQINGVSIPGSGLFNSIYFLKYDFIKSRVISSFPVDFNYIYRLIKENIDSIYHCRNEFKKYISNRYKDRNDIYDYIQFVSLLSLERIINNQIKKDKLNFRSNIGNECRREAKHLVRNLFFIGSDDENYDHFVDYFYFLLLDNESFFNDEDHYVLFKFIGQKLHRIYYELDNVFLE
ncbi:hypothetical protein [Celerinatantimonas sp. YJH-8]|uniref:hypothetical protein n=1 Tax=Celerinatantimonas sp. YJH-8 TaxID=3228714 RepID=UPI0038C481F1